MKSPADGLVSHTFILHSLVKHPRHMDGIPIRYSPDRSNDMPEPGELERVGKMDSLVGESVGLVGTRGTGGEVGEEGRVVL
ncbi:hypothetical protein H9Q72_012665 [Fusarium xylarioides]|uniref:Uncharacterized protein n=1 Tax=Fusarium xylarioides TaxID=221167 RepID=A0A9P7HE96_9HYPO|nr:hypothetical protein H9Q72_012665 [Fusarium xylarioides]